jgi:hypothetical protein
LLAVVLFLLRIVSKAMGESSSPFK